MISKSPVLSLHHGRYVELLVLLGTIFLLGIFHTRHPLNSDEGVVLAGAWNLYQGRALYVDLFEFHAPGSFYLVYWLFLSFGPSYAIVKFAAILIVAAGAMGIYRICGLLGRDRMRFLPAFLFALMTANWPLIHYQTFSVSVSILAMYYFLRGITAQGYREVVFAGLWTFATIMFLQSRGLVLLAAIAVGYLVLASVDRFRKRIAQLFVFLVSAVFPIGILFLKWSPSVLWEHLIVFPLYNYTEVAFVPLYGFGLALVLFAFLVWLIRSENIPVIWGFLWVSLVMLISTSTRADSMHINMAVAPALALLPLVMQRTEALPRFAAGVSMAVLVTTIVAIYLPIGLINHIKPFFSMSPLVEAIKTRCGPTDSIYAGPFIPGIYFETRKANPTSFNYLIRNHNTKAQFIQASQELEANPPGCAILNVALVEKWGYDADNPVDAFIRDNYRFESRIGNTSIYRYGYREK